MQKIAVMQTAMHKAHGYHNGSNVDASNALPDYNDSSSTSKSGRFDADLHGNVNILLGGWVTIAPADANSMVWKAKVIKLIPKMPSYISQFHIWQATLISQYLNILYSPYIKLNHCTRTLNCLDSQWLKIQLFRRVTGSINTLEINWLLKERKIFHSSQQVLYHCEIEFHMNINK